MSTNPSFFSFIISFINEKAEIILSCLTLFLALFVPKTIANKQNQIAIFDKLFDAYSQLLSIRSFANSIKDIVFTNDYLAATKSREIVFGLYETAFKYRPNMKQITDSAMHTIAVMNDSQSKTQMIPLLLFDNEISMNKCDEMIVDLNKSAFRVIRTLLFSDLRNIEELNDSINRFTGITDSFFESYESVIKEALMIQKKNSLSNWFGSVCTKRKSKRVTCK